MFTLTVNDHVRLDSEHVARNYTVHAQAAQRLASAALSVRLAIVTLLVVAAAASVADLVFQARADRIVAVVATALNGEFVASAARDAVALSEGDQVEVLAPMQGG